MHLLQVVQLGALLGAWLVAIGLIVDRTVLHVGPVGLGHLQPVAVRAEPPLEHPGRLTLLLGDQPDDVLGEARGDGLRLDIRDEAVLVRLEHLGFDTAAHSSSRSPLCVASCRDMAMAKANPTGITRECQRVRDWGLGASGRGAGTKSTDPSPPAPSP